MAKLLLGSVVGPQGPQGTPGVNGSQGPQGVPGPNEIAATTDVVGLTSGQLLYNNGGKVGSVEIVDDLTSTATDKPLSANKGRVLKNYVDSEIGQITDRGYLYSIEITDCNTAILNGEYRANHLALNLPLPEPSLIDVTIYDNNFIHQTLKTLGGKYYTRTKYSSSAWTTWKEVATTEVESIALMNGWQGSLTASRSGRIVTLNFDITGGVVAQNTIIANLPYFRPSSVKYCNVVGSGGINYTVQIYPDGNCSVNYFSSTWTNGQKIGSVSFDI